MNGQWKPGDVAVTAKGTLAIRQGSRWIDTNGAPWSAERFPDNLRPLVVIDPEDREQVERLAERIGHLWKSHDYVRDVVQAALREFANPAPALNPDDLNVTAARRWLQLDAVEVLSEGVTP